jgi:hypothetical protein
MEGLRPPRDYWVEETQGGGVLPKALSHAACGCLGNGPGVCFVAGSRLNLF